MVTSDAMPGHVRECMVDFGLKGGTGDGGMKIEAVHLCHLHLATVARAPS